MHEINPRLPGNYIVELVERVTGIDMLRTFVELALGKVPSPEMRGRGRCTSGTSPGS